MRYLLDAETCIAAMRNHSIVLQHLAAAVPGACAISAITRYELWVGVEKSTDPAKERAKVDLLVRAFRRLRFGVAAAEHAARVRAYLEDSRVKSFFIRSSVVTMRPSCRRAD